MELTSYLRLWLRSAGYLRLWLLSAGYLRLWLLSAGYLRLWLLSAGYLRLWLLSAGYLRLWFAISRLPVAVVAISRLPEAVVAISRLPVAVVAISRLPVAVVAISRLPVAVVAISRLPVAVVAISRLPVAVVAISRLPVAVVAISRLPVAVVAISRLPEAVVAISRLPVAVVAISRLPVAVVAISRLPEAVTLEEPPYLTVGTDVSAKYRGAFCEAKIKTAKRLVKAKVTFKPDLTTVEVHDDSIQGPLKVGAVVEVKNPYGVYQEASINKLTDCSIYTVVFDDGDEKTLRRSSLCLKGARHFAESETLDRLPLTNPEHFGTPVIGRKGNRGRRSNPVQEEEPSSSSSEEEESDRRQNEELFGKVVCVEGSSASTGDWKNKTTAWYPALVITPDCHEEAIIKKDSIFIRSFKDGKFNTCALDEALEFVHQAAVPSSWRTEVKDESSSSEEDDDDEEEQEEDASDEEEEEVEPFPEERENFLQQLYKFMEDRGTPINKKPVLGYRNLDLFKLYRLVQKLGGFHDIESGSEWKTVYQALGIPVLNSAAGYNVKCAYRKYLYGFEEYCTSCVITFRMDLPLKQPKAEGESGEAWSGGAVPPVASSSCGEEQKQNVSEKSSARSETSSAQPDIYKEEKTELTKDKPEAEPLKPVQRMAEREGDDDNEEEDDYHKHESDDEDWPSFARLRVKLEPYDEEQEEGKEEDISGSGDESCSQEGDGGDEDLGEEGEEFECYPPGMKVQVRYGRGRSLKTYQATVKDADVEGGEVLYLVHYCGWNIRYDEWVKADKIVRPANKNVQKIKHRKKIKNKAERERNRLERLNQDLGSPSPNNLRVPRPSSKLLGPGYGSCPGLAHHVFSKMEDASDSSADDIDHQDEEGDCEDEDDRPGGRCGLRKGGTPEHVRKGVPPEPPRALDHWEGATFTDVPKTPLIAGNGQEPINKDAPEAVKWRSQPVFEGEREGPGSSASRKRKSEGVTRERSERTPKGPLSKTKLPTRSIRNADWLSRNPRKAREREGGEEGEERGGPAGGGSSSSSSDDEGGAPPPTDPNQSETNREREQPSSCPKSKRSPSKKYNGMKDKTDKRGGSGSGARPARFWDIPEKRAKMAATADERERQVGGGRTKGQKDVWSSIQAQWPKKTLKELFSDSDTEAANSPPPPGTAQSFSSGLEERESKGERNGDGDEAGGGPEREDPGTSEENQEKERRSEQEELPPSGSNSVLNTPPTTPESPSMEGISSGAIAQSSGTGSNWTQPSSPPLSTGTPALCKTPFSDPLTPGYPNPLTSGHPNPLNPGYPNPLTPGHPNPPQDTPRHPNPLTLGLTPGHPNPLTPGHPNPLTPGHPNLLTLGHPNPLTPGHLNPLPGHSETESSTVEVESLDQDLPPDVGVVPKTPRHRFVPRGDVGVVPNTLWHRFVPRGDVGVVPNTLWHSFVPRGDVGVVPKTPRHRFVPRGDVGVVPNTLRHRFVPRGDVRVAPNMLWHRFVPRGDVRVAPNTLWHRFVPRGDVRVAPNTLWHRFVPRGDVRVAPNTLWHRFVPRGDVGVAPNTLRHRFVPRGDLGMVPNTPRHRFVPRGDLGMVPNTPRHLFSLQDPCCSRHEGVHLPKCLSQGQVEGHTPPSSQKYQKEQQHGYPDHRAHHGRTASVYKWSVQMSDLEKMCSLERISFLQEKLQDIRNHYLSLKSEVASIDRRRKRIKKEERESTVAASSSSSSSSSPSSSSLTAAVMLTLVDTPVSSSSSSQNSVVSVECR
uniref:AT-rich interactive domain-containing protein 4B-like n=1 Tax=Oncorhynchus gorbuscha TaxID=8017 RepID=UPI001EAEA540|nr:AT-rich interactive domain-containing protein 4B-like [Oncorhynchus gorbuscha]